MPRRGRCESGNLSLAFCPLRLLFLNVYGKFRIAKKKKSPANKLLTVLFCNLFSDMLAVVSKLYGMKLFSKAFNWLLASLGLP